jgi:hypothetical protein
MFIDEMNKFVQHELTVDNDWQTYTKAGRIPQINEKCFCLEQKSGKWLRAKIVSLKNLKVKVRYLDTGNLENDTPYERLMVWKEFTLSRIAPRAIPCVLYKSNLDGEKYEKDIGMETGWFFKDLTARQYLKCVLVEPLAKSEAESEDQTWVVKLLKYDNNNNSGKTMDSKLISINDLISKNNECERKKNFNPRCAFNSADIRVKAGQVEASYHLVKTGCVEQESTEQQQQQSSSSSKINNKRKIDDTFSTVGCFFYELCLSEFFTYIVLLIF